MFSSVLHSAHCTVCSHKNKNIVSRKKKFFLACMTYFIFAKIFDFYLKANHTAHKCFEIIPPNQTKMYTIMMIFDCVKNLELDLMFVGKRTVWLRVSGWSIASFFPLTAETLETQTVYPFRRRLKTEAKAKVVTSVWGSDFIQFLEEEIMNCTRLIWRKGWIHPILQNRPIQFKVQ